MKAYRFPLNLRSLISLACAISIATAFGVSPANAGGVVGNGTAASCTRDAFNTALVGGGSITFNCGARPHTITLTVVKQISLNTSINGGGRMTLQASNTNHFRILAGRTLQLDNISLTEGKADSGGAIDNFGTTRATGVTFVNNTADNSGGAIVNHGTLIVLRSTFIKNRAAKGGGAISNDSGTANVEATKFDQNTTDGNGGAIANLANLMVLNCAFMDNFAFVSSGALFNTREATVQLSTFSGNETKGFGGAVENSGTLTVERSTLSGNQAVGGGGITHLGLFLNVNASTLVGNSANGLSDLGLTGHGGGILASGNASYTNTTLSGNQAARGGGGLYQDVGDAVMLFTTVANNFAEFGPGVHKEGTVGSLALQNTLLSNNLPNNPGASGNCSGVLSSLGHNLSSDTFCGGAFGGPGDQNGADAKLGPLANNGGPTMTHLPLPGSPAIDAAVMVNGVTTDQRGIARPRGVLPDIGSVEAQ